MEQRSSKRKTDGASRRSHDSSISPTNVGAKRNNDVPKPVDAHQPLPQVQEQDLGNLDVYDADAGAILVKRDTSLRQKVEDSNSKDLSQGRFESAFNNTSRANAMENTQRDSSLQQHVRVQTYAESEHFNPAFVDPIQPTPAHVSYSSAPYPMDQRGRHSNQSFYPPQIVHPYVHQFDPYQIPQERYWPNNMNQVVGKFFFWFLLTFFVVAE
jgi:hypothetical protein